MAKNEVDVSQMLNLRSAIRKLNLKEVFTLSHRTKATNQRTLNNDLLIRDRNLVPFRCPDKEKNCFKRNYSPGINQATG